MFNKNIFILCVEIFMFLFDYYVDLLEYEKYDDN